MTCLRRHKWGSRGRAPTHSQPALEGGGGQNHAPTILPPKRPGTHCTVGWVGLGAGLDGTISSPLGFDPRTVTLEASRYTDYAIPVANIYTEH